MTSQRRFGRLSAGLVAFLVAMLFAADHAEAQSVRGGNRGGSRSRSSSSSQDRSSASRSRSSSSRSRSSSGSSRSNSTRTSTRTTRTRPAPQPSPHARPRSAATSRSRARHTTARRHSTARRSARYHGYRHWVRRRRVILGAYLLTRPRHTHVVYVGTYPYHYSSGVYYVVKSEIAYVAVPAPLDAVIDELPEGTLTIPFEGQDYFHFEGSWYVRISEGYQVIAPPLGIRVEELPGDTLVRVIDGTTHFIWGGVYYEAVIVGGKTMYEVVAKPAEPPPPEGVLYELPLGSIDVETAEEEYDHYVDGLWYTETERGYELVEALPGLEVPYLPEGATVKNSGGVSYLVFDDVWYELVQTEEGTLYRVVEAPG